MRRVVLLLVLASSTFAGELPVSRFDVIAADNTNRHATGPTVTAGDGFLVGWNDQDSVFLWVSTVNVRVYGPDGTPRTAIPLALGYGRQSSAFWNGSEFVVLIGTPAARLPLPISTSLIRSFRVRRDGTLVDTETTLIFGKPGSAPIAVAFDGNEALAAAFHSGGYHLLRLDRMGHLLEDTPIDYEPAGVAAKPGGGFFVLRREQGDAIAAGNDRFAVLDGQIASILDRDGNQVERFPLWPDAGSSSSIAWDGSAWVAAFTVNRALCTARFTNAHDVDTSCNAEEKTDAVAIAANEQQAFKAWTGNGWLLTDGGLASTRAEAAHASSAVVDEEGLLAAWLESSPGGFQIHVGGLFNDGSARPEIIIDRSDTQVAPTLSRSGSQTLLAWIEGNHLYAQILGGSTKRLSDGFGPTLSVAPHADGWVIAWATARGVKAALVDRELNIIKAEEFGGMGSWSSPVVAQSANGHLLAWSKFDYGTLRDVVHPFGAAASPIVIAEGTGGALYLSLGCGPQNCLVTSGSWAAVVAPDGTVVSPNRTLPARDVSGATFIEALTDGSFRVWRDNVVTNISANGDPSEPQLWHPQSLGFGSVVTWRGHTTAVYSRLSSGSAQVFAYEFIPRSRAVRR